MRRVCALGTAQREAARELWLLRRGFSSLSLFAGLREDPVVAAFQGLLHGLTSPHGEQKLERWGRFAAALYRHTTRWGDYLLERTLEDQNPYVLLRAAGAPVDPLLEQRLGEELALLQRAAALPWQRAASLVGHSVPLPGWHSRGAGEPAFLTLYQARMAEIPQKGYGLFAKHPVLLLEGDRLAPVLHPDPVTLEQLEGYQLERSLVERNTLALLEGRPAANVLLYGDAGTGKSATVKALVNRYQDRGLRLIQLQKNQLRSIPALLDQLSANPLKFLLFIDDLSFTQNDDDFAALKAILEGSVSARPANLAVYATSNRRHLIRECFSQREGDEVHRGDTVQELISLSERFGLSVTFSKPNREEFLSIVDSLARQWGGTAPGEELHRQAEAYALARGGRSPRVARQFVESVMASGDVSLLGESSPGESSPGGAFPETKRF